MPKGSKTEESRVGRRAIFETEISDLKRRNSGREKMKRPSFGHISAICAIVFLSSRCQGLLRTRVDRPFRSYCRLKMTSTDKLQRLGLPAPLLLGSASFTRKLILKEMGIPFHVLVRPIDEKSLGDRSRDAAPSNLVLTIAQAKMDRLVEEIKAGNCRDDLPTKDDKTNSWIVLTGDQVVTCNGAILEKPESVEQAKEFVRNYALHPPSTVGSCVLTHLPSGIRVSGVDTATIYFRSDLPAANLVDHLLQDDNAPILSCAGGLMVEHPLVREYIERIDGTEDSVMGLSKELVQKLLEKLADKLKDVGV